MPIVGYAIISLMLGKLEPFIAVALWGAAAVTGAGIGAFVADLLRRDNFEGMIYGSLCATMLSAYPIGHFLL